MSESARLPNDVFIGRDTELSYLRGALERAQSGQGSLILIGGEPGMGKSRLAEEFAALAKSRGANTYWGRCFEDLGAPAFWPWTQALRHLIRDAETGFLLSDRDLRAAVVSRIVPEELCKRRVVALAHAGSSQCVTMSLSGKSR